MALRYHLATYDSSTYLVGDEIVSGTPTFVHTATYYEMCSDGYYHSFGANKRVVKHGRYVSDSAVYADNGSGVLLDPLPLTVYQPALTNLYPNGVIIGTAFYGGDGNITLNSTTSTRGDVEASYFAPNDSGIHFVLVTSIAVASDHNYIYSVAVKAGEEDWMQIAFGSSLFLTSNWINFNATTGLFGYEGSAIISKRKKYIGNDWWEIYVEVSPQSSGTNTCGICVFIDNADYNGRLPSYSADGTSGLYLFGAQFYDNVSLDDAMNAGPIFTTSGSEATDEIINTYPAVNWSNSEGPIYIIHDYKGIDEVILLNDDVAILYVTSDVLYLDDGTNTTSIAYATEGKQEIGIALDETNGYMRLHLKGSGWAD